MSAKRRTTALVSGVPRWLPMALARSGLELPATSLIAPLLAAIAVSNASYAVVGGVLITRSRHGWQYGRVLYPEFLPMNLNRIVRSRSGAVRSRARRDAP